MVNLVQTKRTTPVYLSYFALGFFSLVSQTVILREFLTVLSGYEFFLGILLFNWLFAVAAGAFTGTRLPSDRLNFSFLFVLIQLLLTILLPLLLIFVRRFYSLTGTNPGSQIGFVDTLVVSSVFLFPFAFLIGLSFPVAACIVINAGADNRANFRHISTIYITEALGALSGGLCYTFLLAGWCSSFAMAALISLLVIVFLTGLILNTGKRLIVVFSGCMALLHLTGLVAGWTDRLDLHFAQIRWQEMTRLPLTEMVESRFQNIAVSRMADQTLVYTSGSLATSFPSESDERLLAAHLFCQHPEPKRILVIGNAISGLGSELLRYPIESLVSIEIDKAFSDTVMKYLPTPLKESVRDPRFDIRTGDGRKLVQQLANSVKLPRLNKRFDLVFINLPEPSTLLLNRFYTQTFFKDINLILRPAGVLALRIKLPDNYYLGTLGEISATLFHTLRAVFPRVVFPAGGPELMFASGSNLTVSDSPLVLEERYGRAQLDPADIGLMFYSWYPEERTEQLKKFFNSRRGIPLNRDLHPHAVFNQHRLSGWYRGSNLEGVLDFFQRIRLIHVLVVGVIIFLLRLLFLKIQRTTQQRRMAGHALFAVFSAAFSGISIEIIILYLFQIRFGHVYHSLGLMVAMFMFGLPLGAFLSGYKSGGDGLHLIKRAVLRICLVQFSLICLLLILSLVANVPDLKAFYLFALNGAAGLLVGGQFPQSLILWRLVSPQPGRLAGWLDSLDHLGAALGALLMGSILVPVMGLIQAGFILIFLVSLSGFWLLFDLFTLRKSHFSTDTR